MIRKGKGGWFWGKRGPFETLEAVEKAIAASIKRDKRQPNAENHGDTRGENDKSHLRQTGW